MPPWNGWRSRPQPRSRAGTCWWCSPDADHRRCRGGVAGGRRIAVPPRGTRPTTDRVRESLFSIVTARLDLTGLRVLDLYAGSGALGLEALSRGASVATFVDSSGGAIKALRANLAALGVDA